jgi:peptidoglycan-associated lipoprotein
MPSNPTTPTGPSAEEIARRAADSVRRVEDARARLQAPIYFDYDQDAIRPDAQAVLEAKLPILRANAAVRLRVAGHTEDRGSDEYNLALGQRRAAAAKRYLTQRGIADNRIAIISYGEERPEVQGMDESAYSQNRRDEFEITGGGDMLRSPSE